MWYDTLPGSRSQHLIVEEYIDALIVAITMPGAWAFYLVFSAIEIVISSLIAWYAWRWPKAA
jgi:hypothetical protein